MEAILDAGARYTSGPQWLAEHVLPGRHVLAVAGTHGKTTTTSMLAWILEQAGLQPGFLVGGVPLNFGVSARLGTAARRRFVIEADEYDTAFFDKRSKFVHYRPRTADPEQPGARPRRHLPRPGRHRDAVPPPGAHRAGQRPAGGQRARRGAAARAGARLLERGAALRHAQGRTRRPARARRAACLRRAARQPEDRPRRLAAARRAQPAERAGGHRRGRTRGRGARGGGRGAGQLRERAPAPGTARRGAAA